MRLSQFIANFAVEKQREIWQPVTNNDGGPRIDPLTLFILVKVIDYPRIALYR